MIETAVLVVKALREGSPLIYFIIFWGGLVLSLGICGIVRLPIVVGYTGSVSLTKMDSVLISLSFIAGLIVSYCVIGMLLGWIGSLMKYIILGQSYAYYSLSILIIIFALHFIGIIKINFSFFGSKTKDKIFKHISGSTTKGAFLLGIAFVFFEGIICPCCAPILYVIASYTLFKGEILYGLSLFFVYALGQATPIFLLGYSTGAIKHFQGVRRYWEYIEVTAGLILILVGIYLFMIA